MNQWFVEAVDRFTDQSINASAHSADPLRPATARRATNSARTSWLGRPTQATGVEGATGRERGDAISGHIHRRIVVPIGPCPTQSINSPAHSPLPTARRATLSPARSARPPSSGGSHGGWCPARPGPPRRRKIVLRTMAVFQDNCCHGLGFNQSVTTIILNYAYGSPTTQKPATKCSGSMVGSSSSAKSRFTVVLASPPDTARAHCWTRLAAATGQDCSPAALFRGRSH